MRFSLWIASRILQPDLVRFLGGDPARHRALGLGIGLERLAQLRYGITD